MFSVGPLDIEVRVIGDVPDAFGNKTIPVRHMGAQHVVEIKNLLTVPVDVEICGDLVQNLVVFASGATWSKVLHSVPASVRLQPPPPSQINEALLRPFSLGTGSETVRCSQIRWCQTGAPNWNSWQFPAANNTVYIKVPP